LPAPVVLIFLTIFLDLLGVGLLLPVLPYVVSKFQDSGITVSMVTIAYSAAQFAMTPVLGSLSDRYGRRPVLLISLFGTAVGYFLFGWAQSLAMIVFSRLLDGVTGGNISTAQAYLADITPPQDRAKRFGLVGAAFGLGFLLGPAIGGQLAKFGNQAPAFAAGGLALVTMTLAYFLLPESLPPEMRRKGPIEWNSFRQIEAALARPNLQILLIAGLLFNLAYSQLQSHFAYYTRARWSLTEQDNSWYLTYLGFMAIFMQGFLIRRLMPKFGERKLSLIGLGLGVVGFLLTAMAPGPLWLYVAMTFLAGGSGLAVPSLMALVSQRAAAEEQGFLMGVSQSMAALARAIGPLFAGLSFDLVSPTAPFWSGACVVAFALYLLRRAMGRPAPAG
jgi:MFS transporter, DHA1 family, tetracycline resistance protein